VQCAARGALHCPRHFEICALIGANQQYSSLRYQKQIGPEPRRTKARWPVGAR